MEVLLTISSVLLWIFMLFNFLLTLALVKQINSMSHQQSGRQLEMIEHGEEIPEFMAQSLEGNAVGLLDHPQKQIAMVFVSPECKPCTDHMPRLQKLHPQAQRAGVELVVVSLADRESTQEYANKINFTAPLFSIPADEIEQFRNAYKIAGTPSYYLVNDQHQVQASGFLDSVWEELTETWKI